MEQRIYGNGKLLLTGEYLVLDGATALALPTRFGQEFLITAHPERVVRWRSRDADHGIWFEATFTWDEIASGRLETEDPIAVTLARILHTAHTMHRGVLDASGYDVVATLTFPRLWGLGSSSTLLYAVAKWFDIDPYELSRRTLGGSGYDIACAGSSHPIFYQLLDGRPVVTAAPFQPVFAGHLYFVYLNQKQDSRASIAHYRNRRQATARELQMISDISHALVHTGKLDNFMSLLAEHEDLLSGVLGWDPIQKRQFRDFNGVIKSLGGWGGDFVLAATKEDPHAYFKDRGFETIVPYRDMIL